MQLLGEVNRLSEVVRGCDTRNDLLERRCQELEGEIDLMQGRERENDSNLRGVIAGMEKKFNLLVDWSRREEQVRHQTSTLYEGALKTISESEERGELLNRKNKELSMTIKKKEEMLHEKNLHIESLNEKLCKKIETSNHYQEVSKSCLGETEALKVLNANLVGEVATLRGRVKNLELQIDNTHAEVGEEVVNLRKENGTLREEVYGLGGLKKQNEILRNENNNLGNKIAVLQDTRTNNEVAKSELAEAVKALGLESRQDKAKILSLEESLRKLGSELWISGLLDDLNQI